MSILSNLKSASGKLPRVVLCESFDQRILRAAHTLNQHKLAKVTLLGNYDDLDKAAIGYRTDLDGIDILDYEGDKTQTGIKSQLSELDPTDPVVAGAWLVRNGLADAVLAGAATTPTHVMKVYLSVLGVADDCKTVSGMSLLVFENCEFVRSQVVGLADVSVVPEPTVEQLADIAIQSAVNYERITGGAARVAFLSFSTMGSSGHPSARRIKEAVELTRSRKSELAVDGEMQIDAALIPAVAGAKSPSSSVAGNANVLIFPSLDAGNIAMKIFQKFSNYRVLGPVLQGMKYRGTYIPRASSAEDIIDQVRLLTS
ncbi:MAG: phosphate acyltransferase [Armatimonadota bacterium]|nr:phosphate acyltransferase [Armatimonadota bacterium]